MVIDKRLRTRTPRNSLPGCFLYMLDVDNRGKKSKFWGKDRIFYTGITNSFKRRWQEHIFRLKSKFLRKHFGMAQKKLVFVGFIPKGELYRRMEVSVKVLSREQKTTLINSPLNILESYRLVMGTVKEIALRQPPPFYLTRITLKMCLNEQLEFSQVPPIRFKSMSNSGVLSIGRSKTMTLLSD